MTKTEFTMFASASLFGWYTANCFTGLQTQKEIKILIVFMVIMILNYCFLTIIKPKTIK